MDNGQDGGTELVVVGLWTTLLGRVQKLIQDGADSAEGRGVLGVREAPE